MNKQLMRGWLGWLVLLLFSPFLNISLIAQPTTWGKTEHKGEPWVKNVSRPYDISRGLNGRHIALWASHGRYFENSRERWRWQRPPLYTTCEDLFTQTIVVPYLIPMLENAGAVVFTPRERDWQEHEVIVDNDHSSQENYWETSHQHHWTPSQEKGFAFHTGNYVDGENPFEAGTSRMIETTKNKNKYSQAFYQPTIPEAGSYAVYVSYTTLPSSVDDARYIVWHQGQPTEFHVNQTMGGSTWVYLGTFQFDAGCDARNCVVVTNQSAHHGIVTTDAVRFGGGMGNIERGGETSHMPRCLEGARYYAQWAGMPYSVYSSKSGENDYADDINARSLMLNELCGGSVYAPDSVGRRVPIELSLAVHSDAGYVHPKGDGIYGSLTICTTNRGDSLLAAGCSRQMSKDFASEILDNATHDIQKTFGNWNPREVRDRNYSETRLPLVPSAIFETLSHQSFPDMKYGLDPNFRFTLARSIYKTILRYSSRTHGSEYTVAPLTPRNFRIEFTDKGNGEVLISWAAVKDNLEPSATPTAYRLYIAEGDGGFDNGMLVNGTAVTTRLRKGSLVHFRVAAVNKGGESFPSQVLSACYNSDKAKSILIVDGFHRLSSPAVTTNGFDLYADAGVSYGRTCGFIGRQTGFDDSRIGLEDSTGLGYSTHELQGQFIGGNDFNYVRAHASAIHQSGDYNIVSCSSEEAPNMPLYKYNMIDLALGLECDDGHSLLYYKAFPNTLRQAISQFVAQGGRLLVSGAFTASDMKTTEEKLFLQQTLRCGLNSHYNGDSETVTGLGTSFDFYHRFSPNHYAATSCDALAPMGEGVFSAMLYADGTCAATAYSGSDTRLFVMGFPWECIKGEKKRTSIMKGITKFLLQ